MPTVVCDHARRADGTVITIEEATSGANGYFCLGCYKEMQARKGQINEPHFAHHNANETGVRQCQYSSETFRHDLAKKLLQQRKKIRVPAVYAACPPGFTGRLPRLAEARDVEAAFVLDERNIYIDELGAVQFAKRHQQQPFDDEQGKLRLLARPDIIFLNEERKIILLIEIFATHKVDEEKISHLHTLGIDAVEVTIPAHCDPAGIERLFSVTSHTDWLYNVQQATYGPVDANSYLLAGGSAPAAELEGRLSGSQETLQCRRHRVSNAIRGVRGCLGRADIAAIQLNARTAQATGEEITTGLEADRARLEARRDERDERLGAAVRARIAQRRAALAAQERELAAQEADIARQESELANGSSRVKKELREFVADLTSRIKRAEGAAENEFGDGMEAIRDERNRRRTELSRLDREAAAIANATTRLGPEEAELERQESILAIAAGTNRRGLDYATAELRKVELAAERLEEQTARLRRIESEIAQSGTYQGNGLS
jgi:hypothetical protein